MESNKQKFTILCVSHLEWTEILFQRPQQVMLRLSERYKVIYFREWWLKEWLECLFRKGERIRSYNANENLFVYNYLMPFPIFKGRLKVFKLFNEWLVKRRLKMLIHKSEKDRFVLWFFFPKFVEIIDEHQVLRIVYECMDNYVALSYDNKMSIERLMKWEPYLLEKSDIVFYGSKTLMESRPAYNHKSYHFPTGVDTTHFAQAMDDNLAVPEGIASIQRPILGYWGAVDERLDYELLEHCAALHPEWSIVLIGPIVKLNLSDLSGTLSYPNIHWLGPKLYESVPAYAKAFDVCLMPFRTSEEGRYLNPTKTLEYLATGRPVISTWIPDVVTFYSDVVEISSNVMEFVSRAEEVLKHDTEELKNKRIAKAKDKSWERMVRNMEALVINLPHSGG